MQITNAISKLTKEGFKVINVNNRWYSARRNNDIVEFIDQDNDAICIKSRSVNDEDDIMTDYSAGVFCDNISQAIRLSRS